MSVDPNTAPYRAAYIRAEDGLYYKIGTDPAPNLHVDVDEVYVGSTPPPAPFGGQMWVDLTGEGGEGGDTVGLQARTSVAKTSASLAVGASETGTVLMAAGYRLLKVTTNAPARVRLYATTAQRDADLLRAVGTLPTGNHGLVLEFISASALLAMDVTPVIEGHDGKVVPDGAVPITIGNTGTGSAAITATFIWVRTE